MQVVRITRHLVSVFLIVAVCLHSQNDDTLSVSALLSSIESSTMLLAGLLQLLSSYLKDEPEELPDMTPEQDSEYDFIVVGAGSAGAVVASRLSEISGVSVLLLEAGGSEKLIMDIPLIANYLQLDDNINWKYRTEPSDNYFLGLEDHRSNWPRGRVLGGSSTLNFMIATRGNSRDYDRWAELGNTGWSWDDDVLCYFKKIENIGIPELISDDEMHGTEGPMPINYAPYHTKLATAFLEAGREQGYEVQDYNGENQTAFSYLQTTTANGSRISTNTAYLVPARNRSNLFVSMNSLVSKILISETDNRAYGVQFIKNNKTRTVKARKEVILCAGAIGSPQVLMLSGIGPAEHLAEMGIPLIKDAPVGQNLMDHIAYGGFVVLIDKPESILTSEMINPQNPYLSDYFDKRQGPFTIPGGCEALAFINVNTSQECDNWPNMELLFLGTSIAADPGFRAGFGVIDNLWKEAYGETENKPSWQIASILMRPLSRGEILLRDGDINTHPIIFANYLSHPQDVNILIGGIRAAKSIINTKSMAQFGSKLYEVQFPDCKSHVYDSDDYWECALRTLTFTIYHYCGTAKMGPEGDPTAVVNPRLQVYGVRGLRVGDGSIIPEIVTGHPNIPIIMIGEKLADMVKEDWGYLTDE